MRNAYFEVARTYWRRSISSWVAMVCIFPPLVIPVSYLMNPLEWHQGDWIQLLVVATYFSGLIWLQFRELVVSEQRSLAPIAVKPQVVVFSILMLLAIIWPEAIMLHIFQQLDRTVNYFGWTATILRLWNGFAGTLACVALPAALVGLWVVSGSRFLLVIGICLAMWIVNDKGSQFFGLVWWHPLLTNGLFLGSLVTIALTVRRMVRLTEEDAAYHGQPWINQRNLRPRLTGEASATWARSARSSFLGLGLPRNPRAFHAGDRLWTAARRRLSAYPGSLWFTLVLAVLLVGVHRYLFYREPLTANPLLFTIFFPTAIIVLTWLQRWRFMEIELLRPIDRTAFLKQVGVGIAMDLMQVWGVLTLSLIVDALFPAMVRADWRLLGISLVVSLALQAVGFAVVICVIRFRSLFVVILGLLWQGVLGAALLTQVNFRGPAQQAQAFAAAILVGLVGLLIAYGAYRRWLVTELG